jgi:hypothetical protein
MHSLSDTKPRLQARGSWKDGLSPVGVELRVKIDSRYRPHDTNDRPYMAGSLSSDECSVLCHFSRILSPLHPSLHVLPPLFLCTYVCE